MIYFELCVFQPDSVYPRQHIHRPFRYDLCHSNLGLYRFAVGSEVGIRRRRAKRKVQDKLGIDENAKKKVEPDIVEFDKEEEQGFQMFRATEDLPNACLTKFQGESKMHTKRDSLVDVLKGIGIVSIVIGHSGVLFPGAERIPAHEFVYLYHLEG